MSNSSNPPPVKMAEFVRYLDAVGATGPCSRCGHVGWSLITRPERPDLAATVALAATSEEGKMQVGRYYPFFVYSCDKCGNSYMHSWFKAVDWMNENPELLGHE